MSFPKGLFAVGGFTLLSWFLSLVPGGITNQMYFQRVFAIRDEKRIVPTLLISVVLVFLTDVWAFFMGTSIRAQNPDLAGEMATGWLLDQLPIWFIVIFAGMITCTILSTISSGIQSTVVNITRDCYGALNPEAAKDGAKMMRVSRTLTVILIAFAAISAMFIPSVLNTLVYTYSYSAASMLMPVYGAYIFRKKDFCTNQGILCLHGRRHRRVHHLPDHRHAHSVRCLRSGRLDHLLLRCRLSHPHSGQGRLIPSGNSF